MNDDVRDFYEALGFEETEIEDGLTALAVDTEPEGSYALLTDGDGAWPQTLTQPVIFAHYNPAGAFQWGTEFKDSHRFAALWSAPGAPPQKLAAIRDYRDKD